MQVWHTRFKHLFKCSKGKWVRSLEATADIMHDLKAEVGDILELAKVAAQELSLTHISMRGPPPGQVRASISTQHDVVSWTDKGFNLQAGVGIRVTGLQPCFLPYESPGQCGSF